MTFLNIFVASLKPNNFRLMLYKLYLRFFDKKNSISNLKLLEWLEDKKINHSHFCEKINQELWLETQREIKKINFYAEEKLKDVKYDLGGSASIDFLYFCIRLSKPDTVVETGVGAGHSSMTILEAMKKNNKGHLFSSDFPYFRIFNPKRFVGFLIPNAIKSRWSVYMDGDYQNIKRIKKKINKIDLFHYDSDKSYLSREKTISSLNDNFFDKTASNMQEVLARGGRVILISDEDGVSKVGLQAFASITLPKVSPLVAPILYAIPIQLLAYHVAALKGTDIDQPRNLAKSVTVE